ncbi:MAG: 4Fe-4S binding protein [Candidatus Omnitrophica bacterium]|nr:4Fe-4S binding protein [Candidatus Omnitrophota bacterium]
MKIFVMAAKVLKSLFLKPATLGYPFVPRVYYKNTRGKIAIEIAKCIYCGACQRKCPAQALNVNKAEKNWVINRLRCISCGYCVDVCPKKCLTMENTYSVSATKKEEEVFSGA